VVRFTRYIIIALPPEDGGKWRKTSERFPDFSDNKITETFQPIGHKTTRNLIISMSNLGIVPRLAEKAVIVLNIRLQRNTAKIILAFAFSAVKLFSSIKHPASSIYFRTTRDTRRATKNRPNAQVVAHKNPFFQNFFISFHTSIYNFILSEKSTIFRTKRAHPPY